MCAYNLLKMVTSTHFLLNKSTSFSIEKSAADSDTVKVKGIASTESQDRDGEVIVASGINYDNLSLVNWNHMGRTNPRYVIGKVSKAYQAEKSNLIVHADLYKSRDEVKTIERDIDRLQKGGSAPSYGFSIEGVVIERDPVRRNVITKCAVNQVAITMMPANTDTLVCLDVSEEENADAVIEKSYRQICKSFDSAFSRNKHSGSYFDNILSELGISCSEELSKKKWSFADALYLVQSHTSVPFEKAKSIASLLMRKSN